MKVLLNNEIPRQEWKIFLDSNPYANPFQSPDYFDFYNSVQDLTAIAVAVKEKEEICALAVVSLQKEKGLTGFFSRRAIIYGGILINKDAEKALEKLLGSLTEILRGKAIYIEIRNLYDYSDYGSIFEKAGWDYIPYLNFRVPCTDENLIWSNMNRLRKRQIKKALSNNVILKVADDIDEVRSLYEIIHEIYLNKIRKPLFDWIFFKKLYESALCRVFVVKAEGRIIGGHFCLEGNNVIYDWYGSGLDREFKDFAPSTMVVYFALQYGAGHNVKYFDFMGAGSPGMDYGVRDFKAQFGGEMVEYGRYLKKLNPFLYKTGEIGVKILSGIHR